MRRSAQLQKCLLTTAIAIGALSTNAWRAEAAPYTQVDLVSDLSTLGATIVDPELVNPWGLSFSSSSPFWTSNQGPSTAALYAVTDSTNVTKTIINPPSGFVAIPTTGSGPQGPTGAVNNTNMSSFLVNGAFAHFIFANLNGTISAWPGSGLAATVEVPSSGALYTGLAINQAQTMLYAANNAGAGSINVFNSTFVQINSSLPAGAFATPTAVAALNLVPFNVQDINGKVYVTYAPSGETAQEDAGVGKGAVVVFNEDGTSPQILVLGSDLAAPWGVALAPASGFGQFSGDLLVGNFSYLNSEINAFSPTTETTGAPEGTIPIDVGAGNTPGGLWALDFGIGGNNGSPDTLYFTDGINGQADGLFGAIIPTPEPSGLALLATALTLLGVRRWRSRAVTAPSGGSSRRRRS